MKIAIGLEYSGENYSGWQVQKHTPSVQQHLETALSIVANQSIKVQCAGRTDTGVHALHQVAHFDTSNPRENHAWVLGGNANLPLDISVLWAKQVTGEFNARFSATGRTYLYVILNRVARPGLMLQKVTWECHSLDINRMQQAAACLVGEHDFTSYRAVECQASSPVRHIRQVSITRRGDYVFLKIEANAFLHHMVRNIAGVLIDIGRGKAPVDWSARVLAARDRTVGGVTAAASGLYLYNVSYPSHYDIPVFDDSNYPFIK